MVGASSIHSGGIINELILYGTAAVIKWLDGKTTKVDFFNSCFVGDFVLIVEEGFN
jgi:hypothetical protein